MFQEFNDGGATVLLEDVKAMNNVLGITASGTNVTIRNADASRNSGVGLYIFQTLGFPGQLDEITLDGQVTANNNIFGLYVANAVGTVKITGNLETNGNNRFGLDLSKTTDVLVTVLDSGSSSGKSGKPSSSGSVRSCKNGLTDIQNFGNGTFAGTDYTCDNTGGEGDKPACTRCYPNCPPEPEKTRNLMTMTSDEAGEMIEETETISQI